MSQYFLRRNDTLAATFSAAVASAITQGATADIAFAIGTAVQSSALALLAFAKVKLAPAPPAVAALWKPTLQRSSLVSDLKDHAIHHDLSPRSPVLARVGSGASLCDLLSERCSNLLHCVESDNDSWDSSYPQSIKHQYNFDVS